MKGGKPQKQSGQGADAHTVLEEMRISFTKKLHDLREDAVEQVIFPSSLTNIERKFLHKLAGDLGLKSKSYGKGDDRCITVSKIPEDFSSSKGPVDLVLDKELIVGMEAYFSTNLIDTSKKTINDGAGSVTSRAAHGSTGNNSENALARNLSYVENSYQQAQQTREKHRDYGHTQRQRNLLPAADYREAVCGVIRNNQIVLISGETGCGKTTQVPQFILDDPLIGPTCRMAITQPRRLSAISVAERIASERHEAIGGTIGYNIRLEGEKSKRTQVLFVTPGVLLRKLQNDSYLEEFSHIIIDEAHERDRFSEFLMIVLRDICKKRSDLKLILMSATLHTQKLCDYFGGCPHIHIGGSMYPVQEFYLDHVLKFVDYKGHNQRHNTTTSSGSHSSKAKAGEAVSAMHRLDEEQKYVCSICGGGPFKSSIELGTHAAFCFPGAAAMEINFNPKCGDEGKDFNRKKQKGRSDGNLLDTVMADFHPQVAASSSSYGACGQSDVVEELEDDGQVLEADTVDIDGEDAPYLSTSIESIDSNGNGTAVVGGAAMEEELVRQYQMAVDDSQVDYDLIISLLEYVFVSEYSKHGGGVLIFLPGWDDISRISKMLANHKLFCNNRKYKVLQLHSAVPKHLQKEVFLRADKGQYKIILSTNVAETSITIDDVAVVIDSGRAKEKSYDPHTKLSTLKNVWISKASGRQRKGRAGRTSAGVCFHLFSMRRHNSLASHQDSELLRMPLEELILQIKVLQLAPGVGSENNSAQSFLLNALDPPHLLSIHNAVQLLLNIGCIDEYENVTTVGSAVCKLPMEPRMGRCVLLGCMFGLGGCVLQAAAVMSNKDLFTMCVTDAQREQCGKMKRELGQGTGSDQYVSVRALDGFVASSAKQNSQSMGTNANTGRRGNSYTQEYHYHRASDYCDRHFLSLNSMMFTVELVKQFSQQLQDELNISVDVSRRPVADGRTVGTNPLLRSIIGVGLYPDVAVRRQGNSTYSTEKGRKTKCHPSSLTAKASGAKCMNALECCGFQNLVAGANTNSFNGALFMTSTTELSLFSLLLFCGDVKLDDKSVPQESGDSTGDGMADGNTPQDTEDGDEGVEERVVVLVDQWLPLRLPTCQYTLIQQARSFVRDCLSTYITCCSSGAPLPLRVKQGLDVLKQGLSVEPAGRHLASSAASTSATSFHGHPSSASNGDRPRISSHSNRSNNKYRR